MSEVLATPPPDLAASGPVWRADPTPRPRPRPHGLAAALLRTAVVLGLLYIFLISIGLIEVGFKTAGKSFAEALIRSTTNPFVGLFIGIMATSLIQSSSTTTSLIVGLVAADALTLRNAVPYHGRQYWHHRDEHAGLPGLRDPQGGVPPRLFRCDRARFLQPADGDRHPAPGGAFPHVGAHSSTAGA